MRIDTIHSNGCGEVVNQTTASGVRFVRDDDETMTIRVVEDGSFHVDASLGWFSKPLDELAPSQMDLLEPLKPCYQCDRLVAWLAPDSRCSQCTRMTPDVNH